MRALSIGWEQADWHTIRTANPLAGEDGSAPPTEARFACLWDDQALHVRVRVDEHEVGETSGGNSGGNSGGSSGGGGKAAPVVTDAEGFIELYLDPQEASPAHGGQKTDYRFRFEPPKRLGELQRRQNGYATRVSRDEAGYELWATVPWKALGVEPEKYQVVRASVSVLEGTVSGPAVIKLNWRRRSSGRSIELGWLVLQ